MGRLKVGGLTVSLENNMENEKTLRLFGLNSYKFKVVIYQEWVDLIQFKGG